MKIKVISTLLVLTFLFCFIPVSASAAGVAVSASVDSKTDITVPDGTTVNIQIEITNNTGAQIVLEEIYCDSIYENYKGLDVFIANGASLYFFFDYTVQFGDNLDYSFPVMIRYSGDQPEFSNQLNFHEEVTVNPPIDTRKTFTVTPDKTTVNNGGQVKFNVYVKNTGNVKFLDFTVTLNGTDIETFDLDPGKDKSFVYKKIYTSDTTEKFGYHHLYEGAGGNIPISSGKTVDIRITVAKSANAGMSVTASASAAEIEPGQAVAVELTVKNTGDVDFVDISIKDNLGMQYGGWGSLDSGTSNDKTVMLKLNSSSSYKFTVTAKDKNGGTYTFDSNTLNIKVSPQEELAEEEHTEKELTEEELRELELAAAQEQEQAEEDEQNQKPEDGINLLNVILIAAIALLIGALIPLIIMAAKKNKSKNKNDNRLDKK